MNQFFYSDKTPIELNTTTSTSLDSLYIQYTRRKNISDENGTYEQFVYEYNYFLQKLNQSGRIFYDNDISDYLNSLKDRILGDNEASAYIQVFLTNFTEVNAFTNDFGKIYMNVGTIAKLNSEEELMIVLAHEISHVLLEHTFKTANLDRHLDDSEGLTSYQKITELERHAYSRSNEIEADSMAYTLLEKIGVDYSQAPLLLERLKLSFNPSICQKIDPAILFFGNPDYSQYYQRILSDPSCQALLQELKPIEDKRDMNLATHPSIEERVDKLYNWYPDLKPAAVSSNELFESIRKLANYVYLKACVTNGSYIEGLFLVTQLRESNPNDSFLIKEHIKLLLLITQDKYEVTIDDHFVNIYGDACTDNDFLAFRQAILRMPALELNIITRACCESAMELTDDPYLSDLLSYSDQFLYKHNAFLFKTANGQLVSKTIAEIEIYPSNNPILFFSKDELKVRDTLREENYLIFDTLMPSNYLRNSFVKKFDDFDRFNTHVQEYKLRRNNYEKTLSPNEYSAYFQPNIAFKEYKRGEFTKRVPVRNLNQVFLIGSESIYLSKKGRDDYEVDFIETVRLQSTIDKIWNDQKIPVRLIESKLQGQSITIADNYNLYVMNQLFNECWELNNLVYSAVDEEITNYRSVSDVRYIGINLNLVSHHIYRHLNSYLVLVDLESMGIVYSGKVAIRKRFQKMSGQLIKHYLYSLSNGAN